MGSIIITENEEPNIHGYRTWTFEWGELKTGELDHEQVLEFIDIIISLPHAEKLIQNRINLIDGFNNTKA